jgi:hypothetical protein
VEENERLNIFVIYFLKYIKSMRKCVFKNLKFNID